MPDWVIGCILLWGGFLLGLLGGLIIGGSTRKGPDVNEGEYHGKRRD